jgi:hypothetical protein
VRFVDFLKTTVLLNAAAATALAAVAAIGASNRGETQPALISIAVWLVAALAGMRLGHRAETSPPIGRLLAGARATTTMPEHRPGAVLLNRLWPLLLYTVATGALAFLAPQIPGIAAGLPIVLALSWRRQDAAVAAIEERDGVQFFVMRISPLRPIALERTPGFKAVRPQQIANGASR